MIKTIKITGIIILFFFAKNTNAQDKKLNFELEFTPKLALRADIGNDTFYDLIRPVVLFDAGVNIKYPISRKNTVGSGMVYSLKGYNIKLNSGNLNNDLSGKFSVNYTYNYAEIPVFFEHSFNNSALKTGLIYQRLLFLNLKLRNVPDSLYGMTKDEYLNSKEKTTPSSVLKEQNYKMNNIGFMLSFVKYYNINDKIYWAWGLQFKTNLLPLLNGKTVFDVYFCSTGINLKIGLK